MDRRHFLGTAASFFAVEKRRPNIVLINTDDQRFDTIHALGNPDIHTPNLDALTRRGVSFSNMYSQGGMVGALCLPSRTMLMTGRSVFRIPGPKDTSGKYPLLARTFEQAGYTTFHVGKKGNTFVPASEAFQKTLYAEALTADRAAQSQAHADAVIDYIQSRRSGAVTRQANRLPHLEQPFFVYMAPPVPHDPRVAPKEFMDRYDPAKIPLPKNFLPRHPFDNGDLEIRDEMLAPFPRTEDVMRRHLADYYACIACLDHHIGRVFRTLDQTGLTASTIVLFTSDQGLAVGGRHGLMGKQNLYEEFKSPLVIAGPGIRTGRRDALVHMHDLFPTLCELAGVPIPAAVEGSSLAPLIRGEKKRVRDFLFAIYKDCQRMIRDDRWKLIWYPKVARFQLFDLNNDPWEMNDLSAKAEHAGRLARLKQVMAAHQDQFGDTFAPRPNLAPRPN